MSRSRRTVDEAPGAWCAFSPCMLMLCRNLEEQGLLMNLIKTFAEYASQNSIRKDNGFVEAANDHRGDPASVKCSHSNGSPKLKNLPRDSITIFDLHAQGNGEANHCGEVDKYSSGAPHEASKSSL